MENETQEQEMEQLEQKSRLHQVTSLSKYLAIVLFVLLPFVGGYVGYTLAPEKVVEIEKVVVMETVPEVDVVLDKGLVATTTIDMAEYRIRYDQSVIQLINDKSEVLQEIPVNFYGLAGFTDKDSLVISNRDINYDHYLDIGILHSVGYGGVNRFYHFYVYDPDVGELVLEESLGKFESSVSNPTFDVSEKTLTSSIRSAQQWMYKKYQYEDNDYRSVETWTEGWD